MKLAISHFSSVVRKKSTFIRLALEKQGVSVLPWKELPVADGAIIYNIHQSTLGHIHRAYALSKPIVSLQEGMYALGWKGSLSGMQEECIRANKFNIMQFVWSKFEAANYIATKKEKDLLQHHGNPEYDNLCGDPRITRKSLNIPDDAFVASPRRAKQ